MPGRAAMPWLGPRGTMPPVSFFSRCGPVPIENHAGHATPSGPGGHSTLEVQNMDAARSYNNVIGL